MVNDLVVKKNTGVALDCIKLCIEEDNPLNPPLLRGNLIGQF